MRLLSLSKDGAPMDPAMPLALSDKQVDHIKFVSRPLPPQERTRFMATLFETLLNYRPHVGDNELGRLLRDLQRRHFQPPADARTVVDERVQRKGRAGQAM
jgi:hypothetical protein